MKAILISAGHSDTDAGAVSGNVKEATETRKLRDVCGKILREKGFTVLEDGADGVNLPLASAIKLMSKAGIGIEFHFNSGPRSATGIEVLSLSKDKALAQKLAAAVSVATQTALRGDKGWKSETSGPHKRLGFVHAGGLIVEVCFITNPEDMRRYHDNFNAICAGVAKVLENAAKANNV